MRAPTSRALLEFRTANAAIIRRLSLHGQRVKDLWPAGTPLLPMKRWIWHIVPQGSEKKYLETGRIHIVEAWTKRAE